MRSIAGRGFGQSEQRHGVGMPCRRSGRADGDRQHAAGCIAANAFQVKKVALWPRQRGACLQQLDLCCTGVRDRSARPTPSSAPGHRGPADGLPAARGPREDRSASAVSATAPARCRASGRAVAAGRCPAPASTAGRAGVRTRAAEAPARWRWPCRASRRDGRTATRWSASRTACGGRRG